MAQKILEVGLKVTYNGVEYEVVEITDECVLVAGNSKKSKVRFDSPNFEKLFAGYELPDENKDENETDENKDENETDENETDENDFTFSKTDENTGFTKKYLEYASYPKDKRFAFVYKDAMDFESPYRSFALLWLMSQVVTSFKPQLLWEAMNECDKHARMHFDDIDLKELWVFLVSISRKQRKDYTQEDYKNLAAFAPLETNSAKAFGAIFSYKRSTSVVEPNDDFYIDMFNGMFNLLTN